MVPVSSVTNLSADLFYGIQAVRREVILALVPQKSPWRIVRLLISCRLVPIPSLLIKLG